MMLVLVGDPDVIYIWMILSVFYLLDDLVLNLLYGRCNMDDLVLLWIFLVMKCILYESVILLLNCNMKCRNI